MFVRLVYESFRRQKRRKLLAGVAVTLGVCVATAMIAVATDIGDKINRELRRIGANLIVTPQEDTLDVEIGGVNLKPPSDGAYLNEADLPKIKGMFWRNNIVGFAPMLPVSVNLAGANTTLLGTYFAKQIQFGKQDFVTGFRITHPWWRVEGEWPVDGSLAHKRIDATDYGCRSVGFGIGGVCGYGDGDFRAQEGNRIDESARRRRLPSLRIIFCRGHAVSTHQRPGWISRRRSTSEANWTLHFRVSDYDRAGAAAANSRHRYSSDVCGQRVGNPAGGEIRSGVCIARRSMNFELAKQRRSAAPHRSMFLRMLIRAAVLRRGRAAAALLAMVVAAGVTTAILNLYVDTQTKLREQFRNYGANIVVVAREGEGLPADALQMVRATLPGGSLTVPFGYAVARTSDGRSIVVSGTDFDK